MRRVLTVVIVVLALSACVDAASTLKARKHHVHRRHHHRAHASAMMGAEARLMNTTNWFEAIRGRIIEAVSVVRSRFANLKNDQNALKANATVKDAADSKRSSPIPKRAAVKSGTTTIQDKKKLKDKGVLFVTQDIFQKFKNSPIGRKLEAALGGLWIEAEAHVTKLHDPARPPSRSRRPPTATPAPTPAPVDPTTQISCRWVFSEGSGNVPVNVMTDNPAPKCWTTWSWNQVTKEQCGDYDLNHGPGPFHAAIAERYGEGFTCFSDEQRSTPGTKEGQRVDNIAFICRDGNGARVQTPANCSPKIYMQAAFYGKALTSTWSSSVCPLGDRKMNAFAGVEAAWTVGSKTIFNKGAVTQSGNEITEHYSVALGPKASLTGSGPGAEVGVTLGMTTDVKNDFKDTDAAAYVIGTTTEVGDAQSILKASATVTMTAAGRVAGSAEVKTLGWGIWYVMEAQGIAASDCKGAGTVANYYMTGTEKRDEILETARRFLRGRQVTPEF